MTRFPWFLVSGVLLLVVALVALPPIDGLSQDARLAIVDPAGLRVFMLGAGGASIVIEAVIRLYRLHLARLVQRARNALGPGSIAVLAVAASDWGSSFSAEDPSRPAPPVSGPREIFVVAVADSVLEVRRSTGHTQHFDASSVRSIHAIRPPESPKPALRVELHAEADGPMAERRLDFYCLDLSKGVRQISDLEQLQQRASDLASAMRGGPGRKSARDVPVAEK